ncbi:hypothetical protein [Chryseobacterium sp. R2A-55]|uniref:hypothetical protein n=1 Tax=Chryseobacterium sp. R2A-55 TaxID=2744445 RepID=UPI001F43109C|nr:hypothetical protein [Chryseobacterium sp. R2A-55]
MMPFDSTLRLSTFSGMALTVLMQLQLGSEEVLKTVVLAGVGGVSSYLFTIGLKYLIHYYKKKFNQ